MEVISMGDAREALIRTNSAVITEGECLSARGKPKIGFACLNVLTEPLR